MTVSCLSFFLILFRRSSKAHCKKMATAAAPRDSNVAYQNKHLRLNVAQYEDTSNPKYETIPELHSSKSGDDLSERHMGGPYGKTTYNGVKRSETFLSLKTSRQQTGLTSDDESLTFRSLPPIKISIRRSKTKFMESPRRDTSSVLHPSYSVKTYRPGHHVFTEGISNISKVPSPSFALKSLRVPYSNLPDTVAIYKEKDKFAFGVKAETQVPICTSPYKLSEPPSGYVADEDMMHQLSVSKGKNNKRNINDPNSKVKDNQPTDKETSGFQCKFAPSNHATNKEFVLDYPIAGRFEPTDEPITPRNSVLKGRSASKCAKERERSVSVVSIGESVTPTFFDRPKRKTRKLYPMYDWQTTQKEALTKSKFGIRDINCSKSNPVKPEFSRANTKLSTTLLDFELNDYKDKRKHTQKKSVKGKLTPLIPRTPFAKTSPIKQQSVEVVYDSDSEFNLNRIYNPKHGRYQLRRINPNFRKRSQGPKSVDSNSSTDISTVLQNPPPSEKSHSVMEDATNFGGGDTRTEMVTLLEERERTKTASVNSATDRNHRDQWKETENSKIETSQELNVINPAVHTSEKNLTNTLATNQANLSSNLALEMNDRNDEAVTHNIHSINNEGVHHTADNVEKYLSEEEHQTTESQNIDITSKENSENKNEYITNDERKQELYHESETETDPYDFPNRARMVTEFEMTIVSEYKDDPREHRHSHKTSKVRKNKSKMTATLPVPRVSLDKLAHHPLLPFNPNSASLSRLLQNTVLDIPIGGRIKEPNKAGMDSSSDSSERKLPVPVTQIKLYTPDAGRAMVTPAVSLADQCSEYHQQLMFSNETLKPLTERSDKQLVSSTNISFVSPLVTEPKAKRQ